MFGYKNKDFGIVVPDWVEILVPDSNPYYSDDPQRYESLLEVRSGINSITDIPKLFVIPDLCILVSFCTVANREEFKEISTSVVQLCNTRGVTLELIKKLMRIEILATSDAGTLFRGNSVTSSFIGSLTRIVGAGYLKRTLRSMIDKVKSNPQALEVSLD